ncbi:MAG: diguanylate cyclase [Sulfuricella sp.]|jgi:diguanylate cyclase (GGDEF)-like protein
MVSATDFHNARILIVDDQEANVRLLEQMLREAGYRCITTTIDPHAVYALHRDNHYDLILLDLQMPGMDGFQVMEGLKEIEIDGYLPILVITAQPGHKLRALTAGAKDFISKPFDMMEARTRIHNMLEVRLLYKQLEDYSREMETLALHDPLTGLPNRRLLIDRLSLSIAHARRNKRIMAVMYLDLDGFKEINDTLGHDAGDALLSLAAARLVAAVRQEDTVARLGGDEFVIALWELSHAEDVADLASKVIQAVSQPYRIQGRDMSMTASVGISIYPAHGEEVETLMKSADLALYEAKRTGKGDYRIAERPVGKASC